MEKLEPGAAPGSFKKGGQMGAQWELERDKKETTLGYH